jgi:hypothetical protein
MDAPNEIFMFFLSDYSNSCKQIHDKLQFIAPHFNTKIVNIDNPETRSILENSTTYKIQSVPAVLLIHPKVNQIQLLEGMDVINLLNKGVEMVQQKLALQQQQQQQESASPRGKTPLSQVVPPQVINPQMKEGIYPTSSEDLMDEEEDEYENQQPQRRKIGKTTIFPDRQFAPTDDEGMISNNKYLPPLGEGHEEMKGPSSLSQVENSGRDRAMLDRNMNYPPRMDNDRAIQSNDDDDENLNKNMKQSIKRGRPKGSSAGNSQKIKTKKSVTFIDDSDETLDNSNEKPQGMSMSDIMGEQGNGVSNKARDERSNAIKQNAEALIAARDEIVKQEEGFRKVKIR